MYAADHEGGNKAVLTDMNGHSGEELHCCTQRISPITARNQTIFFAAVFFSAVGSVNILSCAYCVLRKEWLIWRN